MRLQNYFLFLVGINLFLLCGCESEACSHYQDLCQHEVDANMCNELLENQPSSLYECINEASSCYEIHECIANIEDESEAETDAGASTNPK